MWQQTEVPGKQWHLKFTWKLSVLYHSFDYVSHALIILSGWLRQLPWMTSNISDMHTHKFHLRLKREHHLGRFQGHGRSIRGSGACGRFICVRVIWPLASRSKMQSDWVSTCNFVRWLVHLSYQSNRLFLVHCSFMGKLALYILRLTNITLSSTPLNNSIWFDLYSRMSSQ